MPTGTTSYVESVPGRSTPRRRLLALAALGLGAAVACSSRDRVRTVDAELGHDLELASTTGIELANSGGRGTDVISAIEESPRSAPRKSAAATPRSVGRHRHKVAKPALEKPATVMVADHEAVAAAATESAAGTETVATAPAPTPDPGPQVQTVPVSYPAGGGSDVGSGDYGAGGIGGVLGGGGGGAVIRGGPGDIDRCDERDGHGRHGGGIGVLGPIIGGMPGGRVLGGTVWRRGIPGPAGGTMGGTARGGTRAPTGSSWPSRVIRTRVPGR